MNKIKDVKNILLIVLILTVGFGFYNLKNINFSISNNAITSEITITGKAEKSISPDTARINFSINEYKKNQTIAANIVNTKTKNIIKSLKNLNIDEKDIKTKNYSINPNYNWNGGKRNFENYRVSQSVEIIIRDVKNIPKILAKITELKVDNLNGPNFFIDKIDDIKKSLKKEAIKDAKDKAKNLATELNVNLNKITGFSENNNNDYNKPVYYERLELVKINTFDNIEEPEINIGEEKIIKSVSITFEIEN